ATGHEPPNRVVLIATGPESGTHRRLQAVLDNGSTAGIAGVLLGQWRPGATVHVNRDGTITATNPDAQHLRGTRLFTIPSVQAADLFALLHDAAGIADPGETGEPYADGADDAADVDAKPTHSPSTAPTVDDAGIDIRDAHSHDVSNNDEHQAATAVLWAVLGRPRLRQRQPEGPDDITTVLTPRQRDLLIYLALHRHGVARDTLADALWSHGPTSRPTNALHTTLSRLRRTLATATGDDDLTGLVALRGDVYTLNPDLVDVDYWHLIDAIERSRAAATDAERAAADHEILALYTDELAAGLHAEWLDIPRETARRDAIDAAARLARTLVDTNPEHTLHILEHAAHIDPYNEFIARDI
ncbi:AfsR/SARP family transcriptional regulator, partial [Phytoactinopolyspora endophytica]|uniref:AfsR/SARP family transcriptional regulator n=1 Tax=Phytoactinopolyspora endophytica TaxID=1642495 RepID=UPI00197BBDA7